MSSLGSEFPAAQKYARDLLAAYHDLGPAGAFGAAVIEATIERADKAAASGDVVAMLQAFAELRDLK